MPFGGQPFGATPLAADGFLSPNATVTASVLTLSLTQPAITVTARATFTATAQTTAASQPTVTLTAAATFAASALEATASQLAPVVSADALFEGHSAKLNPFNPAGTVQAAANAELPPLVLTLVAASPTLVVDMDAEVAASILTLAASQPTATVTAEATVEPTTQTTTSSQPVAAVTGNALVAVGTPTATVVQTGLETSAGAAALTDCLVLTVSVHAVSVRVIQSSDREENPVGLSGAGWSREYWFPPRQSALVTPARQLGIFNQPAPSVHADSTVPAGSASRPARIDAHKPQVTSDAEVAVGRVGFKAAIFAPAVAADARIANTGTLDTGRYFWSQRVFEECWLLSWSAGVDFSGLAADAPSDLLLLEGGCQCLT